MLKKSFYSLAFLLFTLLTVGCNCKPIPLNISIELDDAMKARLADLGNRAIQVDLVVVNSKEHERWENYSMTKYWEPPFDLHNSVNVYTMKFDSSNTQPQTLSSKDAIWSKWLTNASEKDVMRLYVLALLPGTYDDKNGDSDARRQILPLCKDRWEAGGWNAPNVKLLVKKSELTTLTAPKPEKK